MLAGTWPIFQYFGTDFALLITNDKKCSAQQGQEDNMADLFKFFLAILFIFFLVSNSKAVKPAIEEGVATGTDLSGVPHYTFAVTE